MEKATLCSMFAICFGNMRQRGYTDVTFVLVLAPSNAHTCGMQVQNFDRAGEHFSSLSHTSCMKHLRQTVMYSCQETSQEPWARTPRRVLDFVSLEVNRCTLDYGHLFCTWVVNYSTVQAWTSFQRRMLSTQLIKPTVLQNHLWLCSDLPKCGSTFAPGCPVSVSKTLFRSKPGNKNKHMCFLKEAQWS